MYQTDSLKRHIQQVADLLAVIELVNTDAERERVRKYLEATYPEGPAHIYPYLLGTVSGAAQHVHLDGMKRDVEHLAGRIELWERLEACLDELGFGIDGKDLTLLEKLVDYKRRHYRGDKADLERALRKTLSEVEDAERESEMEKAHDQLRAAGFVDVERDDFDGLERIAGNVAEQVSIIVSRQSHSSEFHYVYAYTRNGVEVVSGKSGEFDKLLAAIAAPVVA